MRSHRGYLWDWLLHVYNVNLVWNKHSKCFFFELSLRKVEEKSLFFISARLKWYLLFPIMPSKKTFFLLPLADFNSLASFWYFLPREFESGHFGSCYLEVSKSWNWPLKPWSLFFSIILFLSLHKRVKLPLPLPAGGNIFLYLMAIGHHCYLRKMISQTTLKITSWFSFASYLVIVTDFTSTIQRVRIGMWKVDVYVADVSPTWDVARFDTTAVHLVSFDSDSPPSNSPTPPSHPRWGLCCSEEHVRAYRSPILRGSCCLLAGHSHSN